MHANEKKKIQFSTSIVESCPLNLKKYTRLRKKEKLSAIEKNLIAKNLCIYNEGQLRCQWDSFNEKKLFYFVKGTAREKGTSEAEQDNMFVV